MAKKPSCASDALSAKHFPAFCKERDIVASHIGALPRQLLRDLRVFAATQEEALKAAKTAA